jgi:hypothetical protein
MKVLNFSIIIFVFVISCKNKDIEAPKYKNPEKCLLQLTNYYSNGKKEYRYEKNIYDNNGYLIKHIYVNDDYPDEKWYYKYENDNKGLNIKSYSYANGSLVSYSNLSYDDLGNLIKAIGYDKNNVELSLTIFTYNNANKRTSFKIFEKDKLTFSVEYKYDSNNNLLEVSNNYNYKTTYIYDSANNLLQEKSTYTGGEQTITYRYDNKNRIIEKQILNAKLEITSYSKTTYLESENMSITQKYEIQDNTKINVVEKEYFDNNNRTIKFEQIIENVLFMTSTKKYNSDGYLIFSELNYPKSNSQSSIEYIYYCQ